MIYYVEEKSDFIPSEMFVQDFFFLHNRGKLLFGKLLINWGIPQGVSGIINTWQASFKVGLSRIVCNQSYNRYVRNFQTQIKLSDFRVSAFIHGMQRVTLVNTDGQPSRPHFFEGPHETMPTRRPCHCIGLPVKR